MVDNHYLLGSRAGSVTPVSWNWDQLNSLQHCGDTLQLVFRMSVYNIVRKCKVLEINLKSEEIIDFYPIFLHIFALL